MLDSFKHRLIKMLALTLGIIALAATMIIFLNLDINKRVDAIAKSKERLFLRDQQINALSSLNAKMEKADAAMVVLNNILPEKDSLIAFPEEIKRIAKENSVNYTFSFGTETPSSEGEPGSINFGIRAEGDFDAVIAFLKELEKHPYFISFGDMDMQFAQVQAGQAEKKFSVVTAGKIYTK